MSEQPDLLTDEEVNIESRYSATQYDIPRLLAIIRSERKRANDAERERDDSRWPEGELQKTIDWQKLCVETQKTETSKILNALTAESTRASVYRKALERIRNAYDAETSAFKLAEDALKSAPATPPPCPDCQAAKRHAYSDATTPGFFRPYCEKHDPEREATPDPRYREE